MPSLTNEIIQALLPPTEPEIQAPEGLLRSFETRLAGLTSALERRTFLWVTALQARIERERWDQRVPGFLYATYGFVPVSGSPAHPGIPLSGGYVFGVAIEREPASALATQEVEPLFQNGATLAQVINGRGIEFHIANPTMPNGTGACWARSMKSMIRPAADGVLTAAHVVTGVTLGSSVVMSDPGPWNLGDRGSCKIDAALIVKAGCIPAGTLALAVQFNPLPGTDVVFDGAASGGSITAKITHTLVHPTYLSDRHPMRVFMDNFGIAGDSGALVKEVKSGLGVGLYSGREPVPPALGAAGVYEGVAQVLSQAQDALQIDLFI
jgi:hypothetical protein